MFIHVIVTVLIEKKKNLAHRIENEQIFCFTFIEYKEIVKEEYLVIIYME